MRHDDEQVGRVLSRREALALMGAASASMLGGRPVLAAFPGRVQALPSCIVRPRQTAGPYFVDGQLERSDIRSDPTHGSVSKGATLRLAFHVSRIDADGCTPLPGALVHLWQCDALGVYSGVEDLEGRFDTVGQKFLRGFQPTDADGIARFTTIYPGWYEGRTVHIHFTIRTDPTSDGLTALFRRFVNRSRHGRQAVRKPG
jgi:protocatechuate 3,4-dioxygenase beta subunit